MNEFFKSIIGKCFLYMVLFICIFTLITLTSMFVLNNFDILKWDRFFRLVIVFFSLVITWIVSLGNEA